MNDKKKLIAYRILPIALVLLYVIGLIMMIFSNFGQGLVFWFFATAGGALLLYVKRTEEKKKADEERVEEEERIYQENLRKQKEQETK